MLEIFRADLQFIDFAVLALLLAMLYGLSAIEVLLAPSKRGGLSELERINLQKAATWALLGILATLVAGVSADARETRSSYEMVMILVPLFFIFRWAAFHVRKSRMVRIEMVQEELDLTYKLEILRYVSLIGKPASNLEIYSECVKRLHTSAILEKLTHSIGGQVFTISLGLEDLMKKLLFTETKCSLLLQELKKDGRIAMEGQQYRGLIEAPAEARVLGSPQRDLSQEAANPARQADA